MTPEAEVAGVAAEAVVARLAAEVADLEAEAEAAGAAEEAMAAAAVAVAVAVAVGGEVVVVVKVVKVRKRLSGRWGVVYWNLTNPQDRSQFKELLHHTLESTQPFADEFSSMAQEIGLGGCGKVVSAAAVGNGETKVTGTCIENRTHHIRSNVADSEEDD